MYGTFTPDFVQFLACAPPVVPFELAQHDSDAATAIALQI